jgi:hypothetical protein
MTCVATIRRWNGSDKGEAARVAPRRLRKPLTPRQEKSVDRKYTPDSKSQAQYGATGDKTAADATVCFLTKVPHPSDPAGNLLSKRISLGPDNRPVSDGSFCRMAAGTAVNVPAPDSGTLAALIDSMAPCNALALGRISNVNGLTVNLVTVAALAVLTAEERGNNTICRTREYIDFVPGAPAWLLLDYDAKGMTASVRGQIEAAGGPWEALLKPVPGAWARRPRHPCQHVGRLIPQRNRRAVSRVGRQPHLYISARRRRH